MMTYTEALEYIHGISWTFCKPGLERTEELCRKLGNPERDLKFIHVAGTNGKGSFSAMLAEILTASGYKTGLYTSPYIVRFNERMKIDGECISDEELSEITEYVKPYADAMDEKPTEFELITAIAFEYFKRNKVDFVVLEAGMGGRLDSTNVIKTPLLSVITGVALDHTAFLGDTVEKIAVEKAGIIKKGVPVLFGGEDECAYQVIKKRADKLGSEIYRTHHASVQITSATLDGTVFDYGEFKDIKIALLGSYQPRNSANVLEAVKILRKSGITIPDAAVKDGLLMARWPARFEIISRDPLIIYDGAHNREGVCAGAESVKRYFGDKKVYALSGVLRDKEYEKIAETISSFANRVYTVTPDNPRALSSEEWAEVFRGYGIEAIPSANIESAVLSAREAAREAGVPLICLGSLYTYGDVVAALKK